MTSYFSCGDRTISVEDMWLAQLTADSEQEHAAWERDEDLDHEEQLAREAVDCGEVESWPTYADAPCEVEEPEIVEDADLCGLSVAADAGQEYDDELSLESFDAEED